MGHCHYLRNKFLEYPWNHEYFASLLTLQETLSIHDSMNRQIIEFIAYIYILLSISKI